MIKLNKRNIESSLSNILGLPVRKIVDRWGEVTLKVLITEEQRLKWIKDVYREETLKK